MKKRFLASVLALCMVLTLLPISALAATPLSGTLGENVTWTLDDSGTLFVSGTGDMNNYSANTAPWNKNRTAVKEIIIQSGITSIGDYTFMSCDALSTVRIPDSVTRIGQCAFGFSGLTSVTIPNGVTEIARHTFNSCTKLSTVNIPEGVKIIGSGAFYNCTSLNEIVLPNSITNIEQNAFYDCNNLSSISIGDQIIEIGRYAFAHCASLTRFTIPKGITTIDSGTFYGCTGLEKISIPASVTSIKNFAFADCNKLADVFFGGDTVKWGKIALYDGNSCLVNAVIHYNQFELSPDFSEKFTVTYDLNGGSNGPNSESYSTGATMTIPSIAPVRDGYTFTGWSDGNRTYQAGQTFTMPKQNVTLTAQWTQNQTGGNKINTDTWKNTSASIASKEAVTTGQILQVYEAISENISPNVAQRIYNLLFTAQYRPTAIGGNYWNHLNGQPYVSSIYDNGLNKTVLFWGSTGCLSYAKFAEKYILQDGGGSYKKLETVPSRTDDIKKFFDLYASPGEEITYRHDLSGYHIHSVTYLTHDDDGFYFLSYPGSKSTDPVSLYFCEWGKFQGILRKYDGYCIKINDVAEGGIGKNISGQSNCPVELEISYNNEVLASQGQNGKITASFGYLEATGEPEDRSITFSLDYHPDYQIRLLGTADGYADFKLKFTFDNDSICYREYKEIPISATTRIETTPTIINSDIALYVYDGNSDALSSCWCAGINETVFAPSEDLLISINGGAAVDDEIITTPAIITFDGVTTMITNEDGRLSSLPTPTRSGYAFNGWYMADGTRITTNTVFTEDTTVYASWIKIDTPSNPGCNDSDSSDSDPTYSITVPSRITGGTVKVTPTSAGERHRVTVTTKAMEPEPDALSLSLWAFEEKMANLDEIGIAALAAETDEDGRQILSLKQARRFVDGFKRDLEDRLLHNFRAGVKA